MPLQPVSADSRIAAVLIGALTEAVQIISGDVGRHSRAVAKQIVWRYGTTGVSGNGPNQLNNRNCALLLENGHILICDENNNRAIEVTRAGQIVWQYGSGHPNINQPVSGVAFASRLENGNTLITDSNHSRIVEIDSNQNVVWEYFTCAGQGCNLDRGTGPLPTRAVRLKNGHTLVSDQYNHGDHGKQIVRSFGKLGVLGYNPQNVANGGLNSAYDAKSVSATSPASRNRSDSIPTTADFYGRAKCVAPLVLRPGTRARSASQCRKSKRRLAIANVIFVTSRSWPKIAISVRRESALGIPQKAVRHVVLIKEVSHDRTPRVDADGVCPLAAPGACARNIERDDLALCRTLSRPRPITETHQPQSRRALCKRVTRYFRRRLEAAETNFPTRPGVR